MAKKGEEHVPRFFRWGLCLQEVRCFSIRSKDYSICSLILGGLINWVEFINSHVTIQLCLNELHCLIAIWFLLFADVLPEVIFCQCNIPPEKQFKGQKPLFFKATAWVFFFFFYSLRKDLDQAGKEVWLYNGTYWQLRKDPGFANTDNLHLW